MLNSATGSVAGKQLPSDPVEQVYYVKRLDGTALSIRTHCIVAMDEEEARELAYAISGAGRAQLWQGSRLVYEIEPFVFKRRPDNNQA